MRDRDVRREHGPAPGTIASLAPITPENWEGRHTDVKPASPNDGPVEVLTRRAGLTLNGVVDTYTLVEKLRHEMRDEVSTVDGKLGAVVEAFSDFRVQVATAQGQNEMIIRMLTEQNAMQLSERVKWGDTNRGLLVKVVLALITGIGAIGGAYLLVR